MEALYVGSGCACVSHQDEVGWFLALFFPLLVDRVRVQHLSGLESELVDEGGRLYRLRRIVHWVALGDVILFCAGLGDADLASTHVCRVEVGNLRGELVRVGSEYHHSTVSHGRLELEADAVLQPDLAVDCARQLSSLFGRQIPPRSPVYQPVAVYRRETSAESQVAIVKV